MRLENAFTIDAPVGEVWSTMLDFERVAGCVPGSEVLGPTQDGGVEAKIRVKVGPMTMSYRGAVTIVEQDAKARRAVMSAQANESRGQGRANATMEMQVHDGAPVQVAISTELDVTGRVAQMGHGVMQDVATRIVDAFAGNLKAMIAEGSAGPTPAPESLSHPTPAGSAPPGRAPAAASHAGEALSGYDLIVTVLRGRWRTFERWMRRALEAITSRTAPPR